MTAAIRQAVARAHAHSPFLAMVLGREPALAERLAAGELPPSTVAIDSDLPVARALRLARRRLALVVAIGDLSGTLDLTAVTAALTAFADEALDIALRSAFAERYPGTTPAGIAAIALGKQGSFELNYSSDIDPILIYDPRFIPHHVREEPEEAAVRIARRAVELLQARDADGYVLRVDLRLRPSPEVTPIAIPIDAAISYYESQALPWERAAFIRARACAGDRALGRQFLDAIRPFVWRRSLDFGAVSEIVDITRRIRDHHSQGQRFGAGFDLKRGRGGIREIEFFAQVHQLIHGGRDPALRAPATRDALARLASAQRIDAGDAEALSAAYAMLRTIEHRVQMIDDRQTHMLPSGAALDQVARLHGLDQGSDLLDLLSPHVTSVARIYDRLARAGKPTMSADPVTIADELASLGFADAEAAAQRLADWRAGKYPALRSGASRTALEAVLPVLLPAIAAAPDQHAALLRLDRLFERLPSAINIFRLLEARPGLATLLAAILSHAAPLADALARRADLLDGLIDASAFDPVGALTDLIAEMRGGDAPDYQARLDHVRRVVGEKRFALGAQIVAASSDPLDVSAGYARLADAAIEVLAGAAVDEFVATHGRISDSELVVLALGRLGGGALTHASDLDLIYLFTGDFAAESAGPKTLGATLYYNRLAQRVTAALSVATAAGPLYEIDTRLRPSGAQGPLVTSLDSFARYQREEAWTWEHMALTRARPVYGSDAARDAVNGIIADVLAGARPSRAIAAEAAAMRAEMAAHKPPTGPFDAKLLPGALVDLEFAVHVVQLEHRSGFDPQLGRAIDLLVTDNLLPPTMGDAHNLLTRMLVTLRLVAPDAALPPPASQPVVAAALGLPDWAAVEAAFEATRQDVIALWEEVSNAGR